MSKKSPTLLKVYIIPVLLLNIALLSWNFLSTYSMRGVPAYLGYLVIVTVSLYLYLMYLGRYLY
ncbi:MAG TPA: hypothetical protein VII61_05000 [Ktedonobacteraceae bacterium]